MYHMPLDVVRLYVMRDLILLAVVLLGLFLNVAMFFLGVARYLRFDKESLRDPRIAGRVRIARLTTRRAIRMELGFCICQCFNLLCVLNGFFIDLASSPQPVLSPHLMLGAVSIVLCCISITDLWTRNLIIAAQSGIMQYHLSDNMIRLVSAQVETGEYTILFVDDEELMLRSLKRLLEKKYKVLTASSADKAEAIMDGPEGDDVYVIVSDQRMPKRTGAELFMSIRNKHPFTVRVLMTAYADIKSIVMAINHAHVYKYISKPADVEVVAEVMRECVAVSVLMRTFEIKPKTQPTTQPTTKP